MTKELILYDAEARRITAVCCLLCRGLGFRPENAGFFVIRHRCHKCAGTGRVQGHPLEGAAVSPVASPAGLEPAVAVKPPA